MIDYASQTGTTQYVTAFFDTRSAADAAVDRVVAAGVPRDQIRYVEGSDNTAAPAATQQRGFFEALGDMFMPDEDRAAYAEGLNRGGFLVSLNTTPQNRDVILDILDDEGTVDMDAREESWRAEGWTADRMDTGRAAGDDGTIDVVEEKLRVGKREVDHGRVRVRSYVVEEPVEADVSLREEHVRVDRHPVDRAVDSDAAFRDQTIEATESGEEAVVRKDARVVEEISVDKTADERTETVRDTVRRTEVDIEDDRTDRKV